jgi:teichuronic acid exporter
VVETSPLPSPPPAASSLGASARASILWGGGFTLLRDVAQFGVMLILVRLLTPAEFGTAALAQAIVGLVAVVSFATFSGHTLQARNPSEIDWQAQFTASAVINTAVAVLVLSIAYALSFTTRFVDAALPLAALAMVFIVEIPATLRARMLEVAHDWKRFRVQLIIGSFLGLGSGLIVALMGGGVWALIIQIPLLGLPAAFDLLVIQRFRPDWTWGWARWRETFQFGVHRIGAGIAGRSRVLIEQGLLSTIYDLATLGIFGRATGLATLIAGRIGSTAMLSLLPVLTRAEAGSARFTRLADLVLRGVAWATLPAAAFLALTARDTVALLYGAQWEGVATLLTLASFAIGLGGIISTLSSLLVANDSSRSAMSLDVAAGVTGILVAIALLPYGVQIYLAGLGALGVLVAGAGSALLLRRGALSGSGLTLALVPAIVATLAALFAALAVRRITDPLDSLILRLLFDAATFSAVYLATLRLAFSKPLFDLLEVVPGGTLLRRGLALGR